MIELVAVIVGAIVVVAGAMVVLLGVGDIVIAVFIVGVYAVALAV